MSVRVKEFVFRIESNLTEYLHRMSIIIVDN